MSYQTIQVEAHFDSKVQIAYLNEPESFNSLNKNVLKELRKFIETFSENPEIRCLAISGRGKAFCSGQNLKSSINESLQTKDEHFIQKMVVEYYNPLVESIVNSKKPVISLVNGAAVGAGAMLALICDFSLAANSAYFSFAFSKIGLIPDTGGTYYLPKILGRPLASYLAFTGKKIPAVQAANLGLVVEVFDDSTFAHDCFAVLEEISKMPTVALGLTKKAFNKSYVNSLEEQLDIESIYQQKAAVTADFMEGVTAFGEKRLPNYLGK